ncbi:NAD-dependent epimerase/dehydratase family protein [Otoolea muris]|uniref:NAD-dependent epimerase/dehydratase family protein n=1 Tax=Otoolea muris TaxID=2941515 RepID=UPI00203AF3A9|nr:NAD(P)-dependent oxidoreductase [Otoolea muris]
MNLYKSSTYLTDLKAAAGYVPGMERLAGASVLITGATGTIGSFIVDMLRTYMQGHEAGGRVIAAGRSRDRLAGRFGAETDTLHFARYDLMEPIDFDIKADYIIHAAGNAHPAAFNGDPAGTIVGNIDSTFHLLEYGRAHRTKRFLYVSSGEVYGQGDIYRDSFDESYSGFLDPTSPRSCYPSSKRAAETLCASYTKQYGLETVIVRPCHTYGPGITDSDNRANVQFMRNVLDGEDIVLKSAGTQMRSYCYVADCASAILTVLLNGTSGEAYNSANPDARVTIANFAKAVAHAAGKSVRFAEPTAAELADRTPIPRQVLNSEKLERLGWHGHYGIAEGIQHTLDILLGK